MRQKISPIAFPMQKPGSGTTAQYGAQKNNHAPASRTGVAQWKTATGRLID
jgi:hypothetical protein